MPYEESKLTKTGTAKFYPGEQFDLHTAALDIAPATEVIRQHDEQLLDAATDSMDDRALEDYAKKGIAEIEAHLSDPENILRVGEVFQVLRTEAIETNKR